VDNAGSPGAPDVPGDPAAGMFSDLAAAVGFRQPPSRRSPPRWCGSWSTPRAGVPGSGAWNDGCAARLTAATCGCAVARGPAVGGRGAADGSFRLARLPPRRRRFLRCDHHRGGIHQPPWQPAQLRNRD
jgi:hypothetical protein